jgi:hypothetical protein
MNEDELIKKWREEIHPKPEPISNETSQKNIAMLLPYIGEIFSKELALKMYLR